MVKGLLKKHYATIVLDVNKIEHYLPADLRQTYLSTTVTKLQLYLTFMYHFLFNFCFF